MDVTGRRQGKRMKNKPRICHITHHNCIRVTKETIALRKAGYVTELMTHLATFGFDKHNGGVTMYETRDQLRMFLKNSSADLYHVHNTPDYICRVAAEEKPGRVIWDIHDLYSLLTGVVTDDEKWLMKNVAGIVHVSEPIMDYTTKLYNPKCPQIVLYSYCVEDYISKEIEIPIDKSIIYEGGVFNQKDLPLGNHRRFVEIAKEFTDRGYTFHIYPAEFSWDARYGDALSEYLEAGAEMHMPVPYPFLSDRISQYQWGFCGSNIKKEIMDMARPNKLFEYISSGIPIIVMNMKEVSKFVEKHEVGVTLDSFDDIEILRHAYKECKRNVLKLQGKLLMENQIYKLEELYRKVLG